MELVKKIVTSKYKVTFDSMSSQDNTQRCPACHAQEVAFVRVLSKDYNLLSCSECKCHFSHPFSIPSSDFYTFANDLASSARHSGLTKWSPSHPTQHSDLFAQGRKGLLLDIGCGNGAFAEFAGKAGYQVTGIDGDATSIKVARSRAMTGAFYSCTLDEFIITQTATQKFDVVTMFEVFEHLNRPFSVIQQVKAVLHNDGMFVGSLPNIDRLLMWQVNMDYELPPYHLTYWTTKTWTSFLERQGFEMLRCEPTIYYGYMSDVMINRYKMSSFFQRVISNYIYPIEYKFEKHYKLGASFYFEAKLKQK